MNYEDKQGWIEAVMASSLSAATKVYAYGIFKHMYGNKDNAWPSAKGINDSTGLATGKYYLHNQALEDAGFLEVTHRRGRSNHYRLMHPPTEGVGTHPQKGEHPPTEGVTPTHRRGTNTTSKTTSKTSIKDNKNAVAAVASPASTESTVVREVAVEEEKVSTTPLMTLEVDASLNGDQSLNEEESTNAPTHRRGGSEDITFTSPNEGFGNWRESKRRKELLATIPEDW